MFQSIKESCDAIAFVHRFYSEGQRKKGGFDKILENFAQRGKTILLIEHPLRALKEGTNFGNDTVVSLLDSSLDNLKELERHSLPRLPNELVWLYEIYLNARIVLAVRNRPAFMAADPLNAFMGVLFGYKFRKRYFHCIDYSEDRFGNLILNKIYQMFLKVCLKSTEIIGVVSQRIKEKLTQATSSQEKVVWIPNSPVFTEKDLLGKEPYTLIYTGGGIISKYNYDILIDTISKVKKKIPQIKLFALGGLEEDRGYVSLLKEKISSFELSENIEFTGFLNTLDMESILLKSKVGFSFYSDETSYYTYYGDSLKIREYALYGIVSVTDGNSATDQEMLEKSAGFVINNSDDAAEKVTELLTDEKVYRQMQSNSIKWAKEMDKKLILDSLYTRIFN